MSQPVSPPPATVPLPFVHEENAIFAEITIESIFYGITFILYCLTIRNLRLRSSKRNSGALWKLMAFLTVQQIALFIAVLCNIQFAVLAFVYHRDTPGGPIGYQILYSNVPPAYASIASFFVCNWFQDAVLLYRFLVIYDKWYKLFVLACMLFLTSLAFSLILLIQLSGHAGLLNVGNNLPVSTIYFSLTVGLNVLLTLAIVGRIIYRARMTTTATNQSRLPKHYVSISAMVIESSALSAVAGIALIITLNTNAASSIAIEALYGSMTVLAPVLITYRVSTGDAWSRNTTEHASVGPFVVTSGAGSRTALGTSGEDIILKTREGCLESKPGHIYRKDPEQET